MSEASYVNGSISSMRRSILNCALFMTRGTGQDSSRTDCAQF